MLKEVQKCESGRCSGVAYAYCDAKFPQKYKWEKSNDRVWLDLEKDQVTFKREFLETKYKLCLTYNDNEICNDLTVRSQYGNPGNAVFNTSELYPNLISAKSNSEVTYRLEKWTPYR